MATRTVRVSNLSLSATEQDVLEFFSFSGVIEYVELKSENERSQTAFATFKDVQGAETAVLLSGATIVDRSVTIALEPNYVLPSAAPASFSASGDDSARGDGSTSPIQKAEDVVSSMLAKGFILGKDAVSKAKAFDERHQLTSTAAAKVASLDQKIGLSDKITSGAAIVSDKVKEVDQKFLVTEKTKSVLAVAEQTVSSAGSAIMKNRYILTGTTWVAGAFGRVTKTAGEVVEKTSEKVEEEERGRHVSKGYAQVQSSGSPKAKTATNESNASTSPKRSTL